MVKNLFVSTAILILIIGCSISEEVNIENNKEEFNLTTKSQIGQQSVLDSLLYYEDGGCWIRPLPDPYRLSNFIKSQENLTLLGLNSNSSLRLEPTHRAVLFYPESEEQINKILAFDDVKISYVPFGYEPVLDEVVPEHIISIRENRRFVRWLNPNNGMPVLYAVWPVSKALPDEIDYQQEYDVFIPDYAEAINNGTFQDLRQIEDIACLGTDVLHNQSRGQSYRVLHGQIFNSDNLLGSSVPVGNLKIRVQYGLNIIDAVTASNGSFTITGTINDNADIYVVYENSRWRISRQGSLLTYSLLLGKVSDKWPGSGTYTPVLTHAYLPVHRAANYFFHVQNDFIVPSCNYAIRIDMNEIASFGESYFTFVLGSPLIEISDYTLNNNGARFFAVTHELGHFFHYLSRGSINLYNMADQAIKESFADFLAWYLSRQYYTGLNGSVYNTAWDYDLGEDKQLWRADNFDDDYTPMFIDLMDDYNQYYHNSHLNYDPISGMPMPVIGTLAIQNNTWADVKAALQSVVGNYFTQAELNAFAAPYDYHFSN